MQTYEIDLHFEQRFIGHPYWPEMNSVINIQKSSGMNRARSEANRRKALEEHLRQNDMTLADYEELVKLSQRPFHVNSKGRIFIPSSQFLSFMYSVCDEARSAYRPCNPDQVRARFLVSDFVTNRKKPDGVWERYAEVRLGSGQKASNQRALRSNSYIENFVATGTIEFDEQTVDPATVQNALLWGGKFVGIGASRKMGHGRYRLARFELVASEPDQIAAE